MKREQKKGHVYKRANHWILRFRQTINQGGELKTVHRAEKLVPVGPHYKTKASVLELVREKLEKINQANQKPETVVTIRDFVEQVYLPYVTTDLRPSTARGYHDMWEDHLKARIGNKLMRKVRTCDVQSWLKQISLEDQTKKDSLLSHQTLKHIKSLLSGIFTYAKQQGYYDAHNPVAGTRVKGRQAGVTYAYSLNEISRVLAVLPEPAATVFAVAAFMGLRRGEIAGLLWENYQNGEMTISRSLWNGHVTAPKTAKSSAPVPVIRQLAERLEMHRLRQGNPASGPVFQNLLGRPLDLNNLLGRTIRPALKTAGIKWQGWHAARRGLGSNLYRLGVRELVIQRILRHANVATTTTYYVKTSADDVREGMTTLEENMPQFPSLCADCAPKPESEAAPKLLN